MNAGIKQVETSQIFNQNANRYVWYPLHDLDFADTQVNSPLSCIKFPKAEIVCLQPVNYWTTDGEYDGDGYSNHDGLKLATMGTDAQVKFVMGDNNLGFSKSGMTYLNSLTGLDIEVVAEIEKLIFGDLKSKKVNDIYSYLLTRKVDGDLAEYANKAILELREGVRRCISYINAEIREAEKEIANAKIGKVAFKSALDERDLYFYSEVSRPLPEDKAGVNMGQELAKALQGLMAGNAPVAESNPQDEFDRLELARLREEIKLKDQTIKELSGYEDIAEEAEDSD